jgi:DNA-directed RNA polymerase II subunit RPB3
MMQAHDDLEPTVQIRELKKDRVNFVLKNVDLACVSVYRNMMHRLTRALLSFANSLRRVMMADIPTVGVFSHL